MNGVHETQNHESENTRCLEDPRFSFDEPSSVTKSGPSTNYNLTAAENDRSNNPIEKAPVATLEKTPTEKAPIEKAPIEKTPLEKAPVEKASASIGKVSTEQASMASASHDKPKSSQSSIPVAKKPSYRFETPLKSDLYTYFNQKNV